MRSFRSHSVRSKQCCYLAFFLFFHYLLSFVCSRGKVGHRETRLQLKKVFFGDWEEF